MNQSAKLRIFIGNVLRKIIPDIDLEVKSFSKKINHSKSIATSSNGLKKMYLNLFVPHTLTDMHALGVECVVVFVNKHDNDTKLVGVKCIAVFTMAVA